MSDQPLTEEQLNMIGMNYYVNLSTSEIETALDVMTNDDGDIQQALSQIDGAARDLVSYAYELLAVAQELKNQRDQAIRERVELEEAVNNHYTTTNRTVRNLVEQIQSDVMESQGEFEYYMTIESLQELMGLTRNDASSLAYFLNSGIEGMLLTPEELKYYLPLFEKFVACLQVIDSQNDSEKGSSQNSFEVGAED